MADRHANRGLRDEAGVGPNPNDARRLVPLKELDDYRVADGEPDIRGWNVYTATGREIGDIEDLLVDTDMGEVVMVDIDLKRDDRHTLAPIKAAWIDRPNRRVVLNTSMFDVDDQIPALRRRGEPTESESARHFNERYERAYGADGWDRDRDISIRHANDDFRISRSAPPPPVTSGTADSRRDIVDERYTDRPVARDVDRVADRSPLAAGASPGETLQPERRRYVRYGPSRDSIAMDDPAIRRADRADLTPAETERLRQQSGDLTRDARDTLVNPPPTEERR
jgi:sporulation protein YlmC with PRC-barrel domain